MWISLTWVTLVWAWVEKFIGLLIYTNNLVVSPWRQSDDERTYDMYDMDDAFLYRPTWRNNSLCHEGKFEKVSLSISNIGKGKWIMVK